MAESTDMQPTEEGARLMRRMGNGRMVDVDEREGRAVVEFTPDPDQCHSGGIVQGGFVTGWIDNAMATAAMASESWQRGMTTLELKISFFRPALASVTYRSEGWVERKGKKVMFLEGRLTDPEGKIVAKGTSTGQWLDR